ncbi:HAD family hydrolase [Streptomyces sp. NRRL B-24484]|uniref:HAD family hydrolase n=1 Tax=Streptomyces sp. NRRL B-24484 TaxID=1463833 RepID=UPI00133161DF|nr:HAD family hydrolase [Streptomyces sp. NRRL B-24484]
MPLLLFDLDNTLLPRDAAYRAWAQDFLAEHRLPAADIDWFTTIDGSGYVPRSTVLGAAKRRYGLDHSMDLLLAHYRRGINGHIHCPATHIDALHAARASGWTLGIVSNGGTKPQSEKIRRTGLDRIVDGWVISEEARCVKPDPLIFEIAARRCGVAPSPGWEANTWMIGDHGPADVAGAEVAGLRSVWLHLGRPWAERGYRPTLSAAGLPEAVGLVLGARSAPTVDTVRRGAVRRAVAQQAAARRAAGAIGSTPMGAEPVNAAATGQALRTRAAGGTVPAVVQLPSVGGTTPMGAGRTAAQSAAVRLGPAAAAALHASAAPLSPAAHAVAAGGPASAGGDAATPVLTRFAAPPAVGPVVAAGYTVIDDGVAG